MTTDRPGGGIVMTGWATFAAIWLVLAGTLNIVEGITAIPPLPLGVAVPADPDGYVPAALRRQLMDGALRAALEAMARRELRDDPGILT